MVNEWVGSYLERRAGLRGRDEWTARSKFKFIEFENMVSNLGSRSVWAKRGWLVVVVVVILVKSS